MTGEAKAGNRRSIRLPHYDYTQAGYYFITICVNSHRNIFGSIANGEMILNTAGKMIEDNWNKLPERFHNTEIDEFITMPNHFHGIISIVGAPLVGARRDHRAGTRPAPTIGGIIGAFKSITATEYIRNVKNRQYPRFDKRIWQRNYYEHVIRDDKDLDNIREYIVSNPAQWQEDEYYMDNQDVGVGVLRPDY